LRVASALPPLASQHSFQATVSSFERFEIMGDGVSMEQILADFPDLEREDILVSLQVAARRSDIVRLAA